MNRSITKNLNNIVLTIIVLGYFDFFKFDAIPIVFRMLMQFGVIVLLTVFVVIRILYPSGSPIKMNFTFPVLLLFFGAFPSFFVANAYHGQTIVSSFFGSRVIWFYLLYFYLHFYRIHIKFILRLIIVIGLLAVVFYYIQFTAYPRIIFDITMLESRGTVRLLIAGMLCSQAAYFYFLNEFFTKNRPIFLILALLVLSIFVLQGTRQLLFAITFLTLVFVIFSPRIKSKFVIFILVILALISFFFAFREIIIGLISISNRYDSSGIIRIKAAKYFTTQFMPNGFAYLFGNGNPGPLSPYSQTLALISLKYGFNLSDIGIIGDYVSYGIIFTFGGILLVLKSSFFKLTAGFQYLKYYIFMECFTLLTGNGIFGGVDIITLMILYIFDVNRAEILKERLIQKNDQ